MMTLKDRTLYRVTRDVENPKPDRRSAERETFAQPVIKADTLLRAERRGFELEGARVYWALERASRSFYGGHGTITERTSPQATDRQGNPKGPTLWELLLADGVLEEVAPSDADEVVRAMGHRTHDAGVIICGAIDRLVAAGKLTLNDFAAALRREEAS